MGQFHSKNRPRKPKPHTAKAHKRRAQKRKERLGGLAAFAQTNAGSAQQKRRQHSGLI